MNNTMRKTGRVVNVMIDGKKIGESEEVEIKTSDLTKDVISKPRQMTYKKALKKLGIEEYSKRIFNSNSHGELFHLQDYILIAETLDDTSWFIGWFKEIVKDAEQTWDRPESVFQHIHRILCEQLEQLSKK